MIVKESEYKFEAKPLAKVTDLQAIVSAPPDGHPGYVKPDYMANSYD